MHWIYLQRDSGSTVHTLVCTVAVRPLRTPAGSAVRPVRGTHLADRWSATAERREQSCLQMHHCSDRPAITDHKAHQLIKNISMLFLFPVKYGINAQHFLSCYG